MSDEKTKPSTIYFAIDVIYGILKYGKTTQATEIRLSQHSLKTGGFFIELDSFKVPKRFLSKVETLIRRIIEKNQIPSIHGTIEFFELKYYNYVQMIFENVKNYISELKKKEKEKRKVNKVRKTGSTRSSNTKTTSSSKSSKSSLTKK